MSTVQQKRRIPNDWFDGLVPENVALAPDALIETAFSFTLFRSKLSNACSIGSGTSVYLGTMFDVGHAGQIHLGRYVILNGARIICDAAITVGDYSLVSWGVVLMDSYRVPLEAPARRRALDEIGRRGERAPFDLGSTRPIRIGSNVWIGFDSCVLPGVSIGDGAVIGAKSVVISDVPGNCLVAGNPARVVRELDPRERHG